MAATGSPLLQMDCVPARAAHLVAPYRGGVTKASFCPRPCASGVRGVFVVPARGAGARGRSTSGEPPHVVPTNPLTDYTASPPVMGIPWNNARARRRVPRAGTMVSNKPPQDACVTVSATETETGASWTAGAAQLPFAVSVQPQTAADGDAPLAPPISLNAFRDGAYISANKKRSGQAGVVPRNAHERGATPQCS